MKTERRIYTDYLRIFATFAVVILHLSSQNWTGPAVTTRSWQAIAIYDSLVRWCVPVFVMISGSLYLEREISPRKTASICLRMLIAFIVWSLLYVVVPNGNHYDLIKQAIVGHYHMWYIFLIIGLYLCMPFYKKITEDPKLTRYFLVLSILFAVVLPSAMQVIRDFAPKGFAEKAGFFNTDVNQMEKNVVTGYSLYFILGYCLHKFELSRRTRLRIYAAGVLGAAATIALTIAISMKNQSPTTTYFRNFSLNVFLESLAIFVWFRYHPFREGRAARLAAKVAGDCFGIYLVHAMVIEQLRFRADLNTMTIHPLFSIPLLGVAVFLIAELISAVLHRIPIVNKYCV